jgi:hypothetical protein
MPLGGPVAEVTLVSTPCLGRRVGPAEPPHTRASDTNEISQNLSDYQKAADLIYALERASLLPRLASEHAHPQFRTAITA